MQFKLVYPSTDSVINGATGLFGLPRLCFENAFRVFTRKGASPVSYINLIPRTDDARKPCHICMNTKGEFQLIFDDGMVAKGVWFTMLDEAARRAGVDVLAFIWPELIVQQKLTARRFAALQKAGLADFAQWSDHRSARDADRRFAWETGNFVAEVDVEVDQLVAEMARVGGDPASRKQRALKSLFVQVAVPEQWRSVARQHWIEGSATQARDFIKLEHTSNGYTS